uniref:Attractin n=1 Tax=Panagrellus redivivus TaxID=6233 RepID=A0A7E4VRK2_PANRE
MCSEPRVDRRRRCRRPPSMLVLASLAAILILPGVNGILHSQRNLVSSKTHNQCEHGGTVVNGTRCACPPGWTGPNCEHCFGRVQLGANSTSGITNGDHNYTASARCTWIVEKKDDSTPGPLLFRLSDFLTECCWDHVYIYDGDNVDNNLVAVLSGCQKGRQIQVKSGKAVVYFVSDLAYSLRGFSMDYNWNQCPNNCNNNGNCTAGYCTCEPGFTGSACELPICTDEVENTGAPCAHGTCNAQKCQCSSAYHGDYCQAIITDAVWDPVHVTPGVILPRASHAMAVNKNLAYIFGGYYFTPWKKNDLIEYDSTTKEYNKLQSRNTPPFTRYDHSLVFYENKLYMFGGVVNSKNITNEFWAYDTHTNTWTMLNSYNASADAFPKAVAGHTAHVINHEMIVFFGYNPYEGFVHSLQIYSFKTNTWRSEGENNVMTGRFGHASAVFYNLKKPVVYVYGGYNQASQEAAYHISDELFAYDVDAQTWSSVGNGGVRLFRHSAAIIDGQFIIVGGNSHNESTTARPNECYSNIVLLYDILCEKWTNVSVTNKYDDFRRYGHTVGVFDNQLYAFGGFNGMMLNDTRRLSLADCDPQARSEEECIENTNGARCIFLADSKSCIKASSDTSYRQSFVSVIKNENPRSINRHCPGMKRFSSQCSEHKTCQDCFTQKGCGWCESTVLCVNSDTGCADGSAITSDYKSCPSNSHALSLIQPDKRSCGRATNCFACRQMKHCSWYTLEAKPSCVTLEEEKTLIDEFNKIQNERMTALTTSTTSRSITDFRGIQTSTGRNFTCPSPCANYTDCQTCALGSCMWCPSTRRCVSMDTYMISFPYGQCETWITQANSNNNHACQTDPYNCTAQKTCNECQEIGPRCGWCDDGSGTGLGTCLPGSLHGPKDVNSCKAGSWFFTGACPQCQCNGHSNCSTTALALLRSNNVASDATCSRCNDHTEGEHCDKCVEGFFGDPRNGGNCTECMCNDQALSCDRESGDCFCTTKGVVGPHCDVCDAKYDGDPSQNKPCAYKLSIDFIFTFKIDNNDDKDKYVNKIHFFAIPFKPDTDVQFSISCEMDLLKNDYPAMFDVNMTANYIPGGRGLTKRVMAGTICTRAGVRRSYNPHDPEFSFGTDANTTFHVRVYNFTTPIKIQISFAQSPPINWILFFVIFASCFVVLIVVSAIVWVIKQRVERYHHMQTRHVEIEQMASRPFASVQLDLSTPKTYDTATPISIEPCSNYQSAIYTLIVRLPTGSRNYTPHGTSGLAVASSLCTVTASQLALLRPENENDDQQSQRKNSLRKFLRFKNPFSNNSNNGPEPPLS